MIIKLHRLLRDTADSLLIYLVLAFVNQPNVNVVYQCETLFFSHCLIASY